MTLHPLLLVSAILLALGLYAVMARRHLIGILIGLELMLNGAGLNVMAMNYFVSPEPATGVVVVLFVIGLAAAEAALAISIILTVFRSRGEPSVDLLVDLKR